MIIKTFGQKKRESNARRLQTVTNRINKHKIVESFVRSAINKFK